MITVLIKRWKEKELAKRISNILVGENPNYPLKKENGHWDLGSNDWFLEYNATEGTAKLSYRYSKTPEQWAALKMVIEMVI